MNWEKGKSWVEKNKLRLAVGILVFLASGVYLNILPNPFIWSEEEVIVYSTVYKDWRNIPRFFTTNYWLKEDPFGKINIFRPLRAVTFTIEYVLWGLNPGPYHVLNILMHAAVTVMLFALVRKITKNFVVGFLAAVIFAVHPIHTETVTWTMSRDDIMATLFPLISWWFFIKRLENPKKWVGYLALEMSFFVMGLLSRETAMVFPLLLGVYVLCFYKKDEWKKQLLATLPYFVVAGAYTFYHFYFWWADLKVTRLEQTMNLPIINHGFLVAKTVGYYIWLLIFPVKLVADLYFPLYVSIDDGWVIGGLVILAICAGIFGLSIKRGWRWVVFGLLFMILAFLPVANIIIVIGRPFGEQREYMPSVGFCFLAAIALGKLSERLKKQTALWVGVAILVGLFGYRTWMRNYDWRSPQALWEATVKDSPNTERARRNLLGAYLTTGQNGKVVAILEDMVTLLQDQRKRSVRELEVLVDLKGKSLGPVSGEVLGYGPDVRGAEAILSKEADLHNTLGGVYQHNGDLKRAAYEYGVAIKYDPGDFYSYNDLGGVYEAGGRKDLAVSTWKEGLAVNPDFAPLHENLASFYEREGEYEEAVRENEKVVALDPTGVGSYLRLARIWAKRLDDKEKAKDWWAKYKTLVGKPDPTIVEEMKVLLE